MPLSFRKLHLCCPRPLPRHLKNFLVQGVRRHHRHHGDGPDGSQFALAWVQVDLEELLELIILQELC